MKYLTPPNGVNECEETKWFNSSRESQKLACVRMRTHDRHGGHMRIVHWFKVFSESLQYTEELLVNIKKLENCLVYICYMKVDIGFNCRDRTGPGASFFFFLLKIPPLLEIYVMLRRTLQTYLYEIDTTEKAWVFQPGFFSCVSIHHPPSEINVLIIMRELRSWW